MRAGATLVDAVRPLTAREIPLVWNSRIFSLLVHLMGP